MRYKHVDDAESKKKMEIQARAHTVSDLLQDIGLGALNRAFEDQRVDNLETCQSLTDEELKTLGLHTIGDRVTFRDRINKEINQSRVVGTQSGQLTTRERGVLPNIFSNTCKNKILLTLYAEFASSENHPALEMRGSGQMRGGCLRTG